MPKSLDELPAHLEQALGSISNGWTEKSATHGVQIVAFDNAPVDGVTTYATMGLSRYSLSQSSGNHIRQELLTSAEAGQDPAKMVNLLLAIAEHLVDERQALARGQVTTPQREDGVGTSFYCTNPSPFDQTTLTAEKFDPDVVFVYLIAILDSEAELVAKMGWRWFEEQLEAQDPNIWEKNRTDGVKLR